MTTNTLETLYNDKKEWSISWSESPAGYTLTTKYGQTNGKLIEHSILISCGKNIGKKNETTILQQTILEAKSAWDKKIKQGYHTKSNTSIDYIKPMLAIPFVTTTKLSFPVWIQPKLDGVRCLIYRKNGTIFFQSRQNTMYEPFEHLVPELHTLLDTLQPDTILDGELYTHELGFDSIVSMVRRAKTKHPNLTSLQYIIYDCITKSPLSYQERFLNVLMPSSTHVQKIETKIAISTLEIKDYLDYYESQQYEGIMIRRNGMYKDGRSNDLLKYKRFLDHEFKVVGHHESKHCIPIFECETSDGKTFSVMMKESMESKQEKMKNVTDFYGKLLTVQYQELSKEGIPRFPIGISFRDYE
jgi:DNA ligase-1